MTITLTAWWMHAVVTLVVLVWVGKILSTDSPYGIGNALLFPIPIIAYLLYWVIYLAFT